MPPHCTGMPGVLTHYRHRSNSVTTSSKLQLVKCEGCGLKLLICPQNPGEVHNFSSTWFSGNDDKYLFDRGVLFGYMQPLLTRLLCIYHVLKYRERYSSYGLRNAALKMWEGCRDGV